MLHPLAYPSVPLLFHHRSLHPSLPLSTAHGNAVLASFDHRAREEIGSGSESWAGDCRRTRLAYRVGEQRKDGGRDEREGGERKRRQEE